MLSIRQLIESVCFEPMFPQRLEVFSGASFSAFCPALVNARRLPFHQLSRME